MLKNEMRKKLVKHFYTLGVLVSICNINVNSQNLYQFSVTHNFLLTNFENNSKTPNKEYSRGLELCLSKAINNNFSINLPLSAGFTKGSSDTLSRNFSSIDLRLRYEYPIFRIIPFIASGFSTQNTSNNWNVGLPIRGGLNVQIDSTLFLNFEVGARFPLIGEKNNFQKSYAIGLNIRFLKKEKIYPKLIEPMKVVEETEDTLVTYAPKIMSDSTIEKYLIAAETPKIYKDIVAVVKLRNRDFSLLKKHDYPFPNHLFDSLEKMVSIEPILFDFNQSKLPKSKTSLLSVYSNLLKENPQLKIVIHGYTDNIGSSNYNKKLSILRAKSCAHYFIGNDVNPTQIEVIGHGEENPIFDNSTLEGRALNRRVILDLYFNNSKDKHFSDHIP